jgi:PAS domain S-box-containing protein
MQKLFEETESADIKELRYKYSLLKDLMDCVPDVIYFKDRDGRLIMVNHAHAKGLGLLPSEVVGKTDYDFFPRKRAEKMTQDDLQVMTTGKPIIDKIERATRADGIDNYVSTTKIPRYNDEGKIIGLIGITRDITCRMQLMQADEEKERLNKKLHSMEELDKLKSEFVSKVSHELRTPLAIIKESLNLVFEGILGGISERQKDVLGQANNYVSHLQRLIEELLDFSRIETGRMKLRYTMVNIKDLINNSADYYKKLSFEKDIDLVYHLPKKDINVFLDGEKILQVLNNLLDNALKFTERGGKVTISLKVLTDKIIVEVADNGIGISKNEFNKLFNKFSQVSNSHKVKNKGIGLGLSIAKEIVERHGGSIWAKSRIGVGSKFYFSLPVFFRAGVMKVSVQKRINEILRNHEMLYFVDLSIINVGEIINKIRQQQFEEDFRQILESAFKKGLSSNTDKYEIVWADLKNGEYNIIIPDVLEKKIIRAIDVLKIAVQNYFIQKKITNVFVNISKQIYPLSKTSDRFKIADNLLIKKIFIGLEKRQYRRVYYNMDIEVVQPRGISETAKAIDISLGGICFINNIKLDAGSQINIKIRLPNMKDYLQLSGSVAWVASIGDLSKDGDKYRTGIKFVNLSRKDKKTLDDFVKSVG